MFDLKGKTALVTGSTQGIGFEIAKLLAKQGAKVFINGVSNEEKCAAASAAVKGSDYICADITSAEDVERMYNKTGDVDILVLNASVQYKREWNEYSDEELDMQINCNLKSTYKLIQKYSEAMKKKGFGRIVTIGSVNQYNNHPMLSVYGVTKAAQMKLVESIAPLLAPFGVTVNNVAPGAINTPRNSEALSDEDFRDKVISSIPAGYVGEACDVAPAVLLLCSDEGRYITGSEIIVDGGMHL